MEDDDEFGDLYTDVLRPLSAASQSPHQTSPAAPTSLHRPIDLDLNLKSNDHLASAPNSTPPHTFAPTPPLPSSHAPPRADTDGEFTDNDNDVKVKFDIEEANNGISNDDDVPGIEIPGISQNGVENSERQNRNEGEVGEEAEDDWESDSEDDLQIVLNEDNHRPMLIDGAGGDDDDDEDGDPLVIVADADASNHQGLMVEEQEWGGDDAAAQMVEGGTEKKEGTGERANGAAASAATAAAAAKIGYSNHFAYHNPYHSQFKYVRPGAAPIPGSATAVAAGGPGQVRPLVNMGPAAGRGRGDWRPTGMKTAPPMQKGFHPGFGMSASGVNMAGRGLEFTLPSHKTIFDVDIDGFEEKPWKYPAVDITDFFNFGLNEESWKDYCKQLEQHRLETTMQSKIRVYESGRDQEYDPDLPPELAAATGILDVPADNTNLGKPDIGQSDLTKGPARMRPPIPTGRTPPPLKTYKLTGSSISYIKSNNSIIPSFIFEACSSKPPTYILKNVSLTAYPSQILAIVGPSGAGKSTLLDILSARTSPTNGTILLNSSPIKPSSFRKLSAYVPQHDACIPSLTVYETFLFSARLLVPKTSQIDTIITVLLTELRLAHLASTRLAHNLSGGERRRVSIGLSLLHDPAVLLLDEPTSGLDSRSAFNVMQTLKSISASRHRTVILSIHQPSFKILSTIDRILLLSKGSVVHHGTLASLETFLLSSGFSVPPQLNALEYTMEILSQLHDDTKPLLSTPPSGDDDDGSATSPCDNEVNHTTTIYRSSRLQEVCTLYNRFWKIIYRTRQLLLTNTLEALIVGLVLGTIFINVGYDKQGIENRFGLFAFTLTFLLSSTTETLPIFINERPILLRETSSGVYRLSSYLIANTLVFLPYLLAVAIIYSVSVYFLVGLCASWQAFAYFVLVIWVIILMANSFVLFLSSLAPNYIAGTSLVTIFLGAFFLFSGYFIKKDSMPKYWLFMHFFSMYKYALDALLINEYSCLASKCLLWYEENTTCMVTGGDVLQNRGLHGRQRWTNIYFLIGFFVLYRLLCFVVLIRRVSKSKK